MSGFTRLISAVRRSNGVPRSARQGLVAKLGSSLVFGATAVLITTTAPNAIADVTNLQATPGLSWGLSTQYGTTCAYTLTATVDSAEPVTFYDFDPASTFSPSNYIYPANGIATVRWTPMRPGRHRILAHQVAGGGLTIELDVGTGINAGSACLVLS